MSDEEKEADEVMLADAPSEPLEKKPSEEDVAEKDEAVVEEAAEEKADVPEEAEAEEAAAVATSGDEGASVRASRSSKRQSRAGSRLSRSGLRRSAAGDDAEALLDAADRGDGGDDDDAKRASTTQHKRRSRASSIFRKSGTVAPVATTRPKVRTTEDKVQQALTNTRVRDVITKDHVERRLVLIFKGFGYVTYGAFYAAVAATATNVATGADDEHPKRTAWLFAAASCALVLAVAFVMIYFDRKLSRKYLLPSAKVNPSKRFAAQSYTRSVATVSDVLVFWAAASLTVAMQTQLVTTEADPLVTWLYFGGVLVIGVIGVLLVSKVAAKLVDKAADIVTQRVLGYGADDSDDSSSSSDADAPPKQRGGDGGGGGGGGGGRARQKTRSDARREEERDLLRLQTFNQLGNLVRGALAWLTALALTLAIQVSLASTAPDQFSLEFQQSSYFYLWGFAGVSLVCACIVVYLVSQSQLIEWHRKAASDDEAERLRALTFTVLETSYATFRQFTAEVFTDWAALSIRDAALITFTSDSTARLGIFAVASLVVAFVVLIPAELLLGRLERRAAREETSEASAAAVAAARVAVAKDGEKRKSGGGGGAAAAEKKEKRHSRAAAGDANSAAKAAVNAVTDDETSARSLATSITINLYSNMVKMLQMALAFIVGKAFARWITALIEFQSDSLLGLWLFASAAGVVFFCLIPVVQLLMSRALDRAWHRKKKEKRLVANAAVARAEREAAAAE